MVGLEEEDDSVYVPLDTLRAHEDDPKFPAPMLRTRKGNVLMLTSFSYNLTVDAPDVDGSEQTDIYFLLEGYFYHNKKQ